MIRTEVGKWLDEIEEEVEQVPGLRSHIQALEFSLAQVKAQRDDLLAACEAHEAIIEHRRGCLICWEGGVACSKDAQLYGAAIDKHRAAIAKAKGS